ncbi:unnamed protein product [Pedinophyceae sp. YPF-701]|nr:unnamed protein product [Pedinophyceae sp. YPF-701]
MASASADKGDGKGRKQNMSATQLLLAALAVLGIFVVGIFSASFVSNARQAAEDAKVVADAGGPPAGSVRARLREKAAEPGFSLRMKKGVLEWAFSKPTFSPRAVWEVVESNGVAHIKATANATIWYTETHMNSAPYLSIPQVLTIYPTHPEVRKLLKPKELGTYWRQECGDTTMALALEVWKDGKSFWADYLDTLPADPDHPLLWPESDLERLRKIPSAGPIVERREKIVQEMYDTLKGQVAKNLPAGHIFRKALKSKKKKAVVMDDLRWAHAVVMHQSLEGVGSPEAQRHMQAGCMLVPLVDDLPRVNNLAMLSMHMSPDHPSGLAVELNSMVNASAGDPVTVHTGGPACNGRALATHGWLTDEARLGISARLLQRSMRRHDCFSSEITPAMTLEAAAAVGVNSTVKTEKKFVDNIRRQASKARASKNQVQQSQALSPVQQLDFSTKHPLDGMAFLYIEAGLRLKGEEARNKSVLVLDEIFRRWEDSVPDIEHKTPFDSIREARLWHAVDGAQLALKMAVCAIKPDNSCDPFKLKDELYKDVTSKEEVMEALGKQQTKPKNRKSLFSRIFGGGEKKTDL